MATPKKQHRRRAEHIPPVRYPTQLPADDIAPDDPIVAYFLSSPGAVEIATLHMESPALQKLKAAGVKLAIPLVNQGELVGLLSLGPRRSQQVYSVDDRALLSTLASQAAPAVRVAQLVRHQQSLARERERVEQEMRVARIIQQTLLPKEVPALPGWEVTAYYQPARAVGGDFYDFLYLEDGRLGIIIGDVTDKGVPAALLMASTRSILRSTAQGGLPPGKVLEITNDLLCPDIPPKMFVTCLYAILDPASGTLAYANAGHDLPYRRTADGVAELRASGMPLGLMPGMRYDEHTTTIAPREHILFYSDGLVEAHDATGTMFGFPRLKSLFGAYTGDFPLIAYLLADLQGFCGANAEQEDDVTLVTLHRAAPNPPDDWRLLDEWSIPSVMGNERAAVERITEIIQSMGLSERRLEQLETAVAEAIMNAIEHGNHGQADRPVTLHVLASPLQVAVRISDTGPNGDQLVPAQTPDLAAKLAGEESPRGWGLFLIQHLVDDLRTSGDATHHTVELIMAREGESHAG